MSEPWTKERQRERDLATCVHFNGYGIRDEKKCRAGVRYLDVQDDSNNARRWPCTPPLGKRPVCTTECSLRQFPTPEAVDAKEAEIQAAIAEALAKIALGECHVCGAKVEQRKQVGRCAYAEPCGHRIGQVDTGDDE